MIVSLLAKSGYSGFVNLLRSSVVRRRSERQELPRNPLDVRTALRLYRVRGAEKCRRKQQRRRWATPLVIELFLQPSTARSNVLSKKDRSSNSDHKTYQGGNHWILLQPECGH